MQPASRLQRHGDALKETLKAAREDEAALDVLRHQTERRLRLRRLALDTSVPREKLRSCCVRLNQATDELRGVLDGLSVRVSHVNYVAPESNYIDVAWNFEV